MRQGAKPWRQKENPQTPIKQIGKEEGQGANTIEQDRPGKFTDTYRADRKKEEGQGAKEDKEAREQYQ